MTITGHIITLNEAHNITECIASLRRVCDEIIVVDSGSSDATVAIAEELGATVIPQPYLGDGPQKNVAAKHARNDWLLSLDADERLDEEAIDAIKRLALDDPTTAYGFFRKNFIGSRWIRRCGWYPDPNVRLYHRRHAAWSDALGHAKVEAPKSQILPGHILHYSYRNYEELFFKANRFSTRGAKMMAQKGKRAAPLSAPAHMAAAFLRKYLLQLGFLEGLDGLSIALSASLNAYLKYAKLYEMQKEGQTSDSLWEQ